MISETFDASCFDVKAMISALYVYPIKSCAAVAMTECELTPMGLLHDREFMIVDENNRFLTQRELPQMVLIVPDLVGFDSSKATLQLSAPNCLDFELDLSVEGQSVQAFVWDDSVAAFDMGDGVAVWLSQVLERTARLVRFDARSKRECSDKWTDGVPTSTMFADGYPVLVTTDAAIELLNERLSGSDENVTALRFRPNIVLADLGAHDEDLIDVFHVDAGQTVQLKNVKPCTRCPIPNVNPATGNTKTAVTDTLLGYRRDARMNDEVTFGINAIVTAGAGQVLRVGQVVGADYVF